jgi:hypothetical protein
MREALPVPIAELLSSGTPLFPYEAVAVALDLCRQMSHRRPGTGVTPAISTSTVSIDPSGMVTMVGGVPGEDEQSVLLVGRLLVEMLERVTPHESVAPRLKATASSAATNGQLKYASLAHLDAAIRKHGPEDGPSSAIRGVFERWLLGRNDRERVGLQGPAGAPRRTSPLTSDVLRRAAREADAETAREVPFALALPVGLRFGGRHPARVAAAAVMTLLLAGAGFLFLFSPSRGEMPLVAPITRPTPVSPRREPGWELLGKPARVSAAPRQPSGRSGRSPRTDEPLLLAPTSGHPDGVVATR